MSKRKHEEEEPHDVEERASSRARVDEPEETQSSIAPAQSSKESKIEYDFSPDSENPETPDLANKVPQSLREEIIGGLRLEWVGLNEYPLAQEEVKNPKFTGRWDDLKTNHVILKLSFKNVQQEDSNYTKAGTRGVVLDFCPRFADSGMPNLRTGRDDTLMVRPYTYAGDHRRTLHTEELHLPENTDIRVKDILHIILSNNMLPAGFIAEISGTSGCRDFMSQLTCHLNNARIISLPDDRTALWGAFNTLYGLNDATLEYFVHIANWTNPKFKHTTILGIRYAPDNSNSGCDSNYSVSGDGGGGSISVGHGAPEPAPASTPAPVPAAVPAPKAAPMQFTDPISSRLRKKAKKNYKC